MLIKRENSLLLVVDVQAKLAPAIFEGEAAIANNVRLLTAARHFAIPRFISEQYVRGLGPSVEAIRIAAATATAADPAVDAIFFEKIHFSCTAEAGVVDKLNACGRMQVILTGMEAHVCVLQTAFGLLANGFEVFLVADASSSRTPENRRLAFERLQAAGVQIVSTEMVLFEWLEKADSADFRKIIPLIK
jgi:nicotinamidase-related amidase